MTKWNCSISATPPRIASAAEGQGGHDAPEQQPRAVLLGTSKYGNSRMKTNRLSSDNERSMKYTAVRHGVVAVGQQQHHDRGEEGYHEPADAPDHALAEAWLPPAREEVQIDPQEEDRDGREDEPRTGPEKKRERHGVSHEVDGVPQHEVERQQLRSSNHVDSPSCVTCRAISTANKTAPVSKPLKTSASGNSPTNSESSTSTGAANSAICAGADRDEIAGPSCRAGEVDRHPVLGGVADGHHDDADEERGEADALGASSVSSRPGSPTSAHGDAGEG